MHNLDEPAQRQVIEDLKKLLERGVFDTCLSTMNYDDNKLNRALLALFDRLADPRTAAAIIPLLLMNGSAPKRNMPCVPSALLP